MRAGARDVAAGADAGALRVLVVDDEPSICRALTIAFQRDGCDVAAATSGSAALAIVRRRPIDVLVVDLRIPDLRGDVIYHYAAALQPPLRRATLLMTGDVSDRAEVLLEACGCPTVRKPFLLVDVIAAVRALAPGERGGARRFRA